MSALNSTPVVDRLPKQAVIS